MATRPLDINEYKKIIGLMTNGFINMDGRVFRKNSQVALALQLQASLGLRIGDVLRLQMNNFQNGRLETKETKTDKLQYREINRDVFDRIKDYAIENKLSQTSKLFDIDVRAVQKQLKLVTVFLGLNNISTHSFRKLFATTAYEQNQSNIELVKELLNHSSIATTQRYIKVSQQAIDRASANMNFMI